uniref:Alpha-macroglobulin-like TED domain-containing protein n=1 Tax=Knipowitschia caucasica TaxID=637954 RepID=A0AAV2LVG6_KNICA
MDKTHSDEICLSLKYLVKVQSPDGSFTETFPVRDTGMSGGLQGADDKATLSAFVAIALAEVKEANLDCDYMGIITEQAYDRVFAYLKWVPSTRPYTTAIVSYALSLLPGWTFDPTKRLLEASSGGAGAAWETEDEEEKPEVKPGPFSEPGQDMVMLMREFLADSNARKKGCW